MLYGFKTLVVVRILPLHYAQDRDQRTSLCDTIELNLSLLIYHRV